MQSQAKVQPPTHTKKKRGKNRTTKVIQPPAQPYSPQKKKSSEIDETQRTHGKNPKFMAEIREVVCTNQITPNYTNIYVKNGKNKKKACHAN